MMTGEGTSRSLSFRLSSSPLKPGIWRSETTTSKRSRSPDRKLAADENASARTPKDRKRLASEARAGPYSSTIAMTALEAHGQIGGESRRVRVRLHGWVSVGAVLQKKNIER